jgi:tRNA threonylcarbamoyladenosine biosynthesis protein TsaB
MKAKPARHLLAIDTATAWQSVALLQDERVLALLEQDAEGSHARSLMGAIDRLLREAGTFVEGSSSVGRVDRARLVHRPACGACHYVGISCRVGHSYRNGADLGSDGLEPARCEGVLVPVLKSRHNEVYWAAYEWQPGTGLRTLTSPSRSALLLRWPGRYKGPTRARCLATAGKPMKKEIREAVEAVGGQVREVRPDRQRPSARQCRPRGETAPGATGQVAEKPALVPRYVQRTEAESQVRRTARRLGARAAAAAGGQASWPRADGNVAKKQRP